MYEFVREVSGGRGEGWKGVAGTAVAGGMATVSSDALMNPFDGELGIRLHLGNDQCGMFGSEGGKGTSKRELVKPCIWSTACGLTAL
jgi:hypothetical protein